MSNPFAPPVQQHPQHQQPPQAQFGPPVPQGMPAGSLPMWAPQPFAPAPKQGNGLAITAIVMSGLALLAVLAVAVFIFVGSGASSGWVLSGEVTPIDKGVTDVALQDSLAAVIKDDGGSVDELECPVRSQVGQGLVTVCHGSVDGFDWTGVVVLEDDDGTFIVTEY